MSIPPTVTAVAHKRPWSLCQKCWWQVTPKQVYITDPTKLEWADFFFFLVVSTSFIPCGKCGSSYLGKATAAAREALPILDGVCVVFSCVQTKVRLPVLGIFNVRLDVNACDCTQGLCMHHKRVCNES